VALFVALETHLLAKQSDWLPSFKAKHGTKKPADVNLNFMILWVVLETHLNKAKWFNYVT
jgi:hypothetical protein